MKRAIAGMAVIFHDVRRRLPHSGRSIWRQAFRAMQSNAFEWTLHRRARRTVNLTSLATGSGSGAKAPSSTGARRPDSKPDDARSARAPPPIRTRPRLPRSGDGRKRSRRPADDAVGLELKKQRMDLNDKDNPDANCLPMGLTQFHAWAATQDHAELERDRDHA